tara:strand:- start:57 stop:1112 length:1056 start_codon:yes stop_codon:yes gene_type:complete
MAYTTIDNPELFFQVKTYTGTGSAQSITLDGSEDMQPDWVWIKNRGATARHMLFDVVRGATKSMASDSDSAETTSSGHLTSFNSDGFSLGDNSGTGSTNGSSETYVAWNWKAGGSASSNTDGSITTSVSASTTSGFSIATYTSNGTVGATVGHGLEVAPDMVWTLNRTGNDSYGVGSNFLTSWDYYLHLSRILAPENTHNVWNDTAPSSSVVTFGNNGRTNTPNDEDYIMYCFHSVKGFSKIGKFAGNNNADGIFLYLGFKPALIIIKDISSTDPWHMIDNKRSPINLVNERLFVNNDNAKNTSADICDFVSNGIKFRGTNDGFNGSRNYIYMAFAESPFVNSKGVPNNAR